jgi:hypothetical protein
MTSQFLTSKLELLRLVVSAEESLQIIGGITTHDAGLRLAAKAVKHSGDDEVIHGAISALFPADYAGDSIGQIREWIASARRKGFDELQSPKKQNERASASDMLVRLFEQSGASLFHDPHQRAYLTVSVEPDGYRHLALNSSEARRWLTKIVYDAGRRTISRTALDSAIGTLEARALLRPAAALLRGSFIQTMNCSYSKPRARF